VAKPLEEMRGASLLLEGIAERLKFLSEGKADLRDIAIASGRQLEVKGQR